MISWVAILSSTKSNGIGRRGGGGGGGRNNTTDQKKVVLDKRDTCNGRNVTYLSKNEGLD
jgi:hypothetical protein